MRKQTIAPTDGTCRAKREQPQASAQEARLPPLPSSARRGAYVMSSQGAAGALGVSSGLSQPKAPKSTKKQALFNMPGAWAFGFRSRSWTCLPEHLSVLFVVVGFVMAYFLQALPVDKIARRPLQVAGSEAGSGPQAARPHEAPGPPNLRPIESASAVHIQVGCRNTGSDWEAALFWLDHARQPKLAHQQGQGANDCCRLKRFADVEASLDRRRR